jgi:pantoate--beta-alanine ligase
MSTPEVIQEIAAMRTRVESLRSEGKRVAFVPTMGALHAGHAELLRVARAQADVVVASIFVNPIQFDRKDDFERYPQTMEHDLRVCEAQDTAVVFAPAASEFYPAEPLTFVESPVLGRHLCGAFRPGHFRGVATVVMKLFHVVPAHLACFGQKDAQQLAIIRRMVSDLNVPIEIVAVPTVREPDGLALSSRNQHLSAAERRVAPVLYRALQAAEQSLHRGERDAESVLRPARELLAAEPAVRAEYLELVDAETLQPLEQVQHRALLAGALWLGNTRLIDNIPWNAGQA